MPRDENEIIQWLEGDQNPQYVYDLIQSEDFDTLYLILPAVDNAEALLKSSVLGTPIIDALLAHARKYQSALEVVRYIDLLKYYTFSDDQALEFKLERFYLALRASDPFFHSGSSSSSSFDASLSESVAQATDRPAIKRIWGEIRNINEQIIGQWAISERLLMALERIPSMQTTLEAMRTGAGVLYMARSEKGSVGIKALTGNSGVCEYKQYQEGNLRIMGNYVDAENKQLVFVSLKSHNQARTYKAQTTLPKLAGFELALTDIEPAAPEVPQTLSSPPTPPSVKKISSISQSGPLKPVARKITFLGGTYSSDTDDFEARLKQTHTKAQNAIDSLPNLLSTYVKYLTEGSSFPYPYDRHSLVNRLEKLIAAAECAGSLVDRAREDLRRLKEFYPVQLSEYVEALPIGTHPEALQITFAKAITIKSYLTANAQAKLDLISVRLNIAEMEKYYHRISDGSEPEGVTRLSNILHMLTSVADLTESQVAHVAFLNAWAAQRQIVNVQPSVQSIPPSISETSKSTNVPKLVKERMLVQVQKFNLVAYFVEFTKDNVCRTIYVLSPDTDIDSICGHSLSTETAWATVYVTTQIFKFYPIFQSYGTPVALSGINCLQYAAKRYASLGDKPDVMHAMAFGMTYYFAGVVSHNVAILYILPQVANIFPSLMPYVRYIKHIKLKWYTIDPLSLASCVAMFGVHYIALHDKEIIFEEGEYMRIGYLAPYVFGSVIFGVGLLAGYSWIATAYGAFTAFNVATMGVDVYSYLKYGHPKLIAKLLRCAGNNDIEAMQHELAAFDSDSLNEVSIYLNKLHAGNSHEHPKFAKNIYKILKILNTTYGISVDSMFFPEFLDYFKKPKMKGAVANLAIFVASIMYGDIDVAREFISINKNYLKEWNSAQYLIQAAHYNNLNVFLLLIQYVDTYVLEELFISLLQIINDQEKSFFSKSDGLKKTAPNFTESRLVPYIEALLNAGVSANMKAKAYPYSIICSMVAMKFTLIAKLLVDYGADLSEGCGDLSIIKIALHNEQYELVAFILMRGVVVLLPVSPEQQNLIAMYLNKFIDKNSYERINIVYACSSLQTLSAQIDVSTTCSELYSLHKTLLELIEGDHLDAAKEFVSLHPELIYLGDKDNTPTMVHAIKYDREEILLELIRRLKIEKAEPSLSVSHAKKSDLITHQRRTSNILSSALAHAINIKSIKYIEILANSGADINRKFHHTPMVMAAIIGSVGVIKTLLKFGADINDRSEKGITLLDGALYSSQIDAAIFLVFQGADVSAMKSHYPAFTRFAEDLHHFCTNMPILDIRALDNACKALLVLHRKGKIEYIEPLACKGADFEVRGQHAKAKAEYKKATESEKWHDTYRVEAMYRLANIYSMEGDSKMAVHYYEKAAEKGHLLSKWELYIHGGYYADEKTKEVLISLSQDNFGPAIVGRGVMLALDGKIKEGKEMLIQAEERHGLGNEHLRALTRCEKQFPSDEGFVDCFQDAANAINKASLPGYIDPLEYE